MIMQTTDPFAELPIASFVGIILDGGERADEAMYYLLQQRLYHQLKRKYEIFQHQLLDDFDDILNDYFFYLRDGKGETDKTDGEENTTGNEDAEPDSEERLPYPSLRRIRSREAFAQWLLRTFRNYLCVRATKEAPFASSGLSAADLSVSGFGNCHDTPSDNTLAADISSDCIVDNTYGSFSVPDSPPSILTDEQKLFLASNLIAYAHQEMSSRDRFLLLRALLTMLDKRQALPNEEVAEALGMTEVSYRVTVHRVKDRLAQYRARLLKGEPLHLDNPHRQMAQSINKDFLHLYPTLLSYYDQSIAALPPDRADAVNRLRQNHFATTGHLLHESETPYTKKLSKTALWNVVERIIGG